MANVRETSPEEFGAVGDGKANDWVAIQHAVDSCANFTSCRVKFSKSYLSGYILIKSSGITFDLEGTLSLLPKRIYTKLHDYEKYNFISNQGTKKFISGFQLIGGGTIQSTSAIAWWLCKLSGRYRPYLLYLENMENVRVENVHFVDSPNHNIEVSNCTHVRVNELYVDAPHNSPNTDGINFYGGMDQSLTNSVISNGDDCVSVVAINERAPQCVPNPDQFFCAGGNLRVKNVTCKGGHGISIGGMNHGVVRNVTFENMTATGGPSQGIYSAGGLRLKSYPNGTGLVSDIIYRNIVLDGVYLPIQILARYCPWPSKCPPSVTSVGFSNISFINIRGRGKQKGLVGAFKCAKVASCKNILLDNVALNTSVSDNKYECENADLIFKGYSNPNKCTPPEGM